MRPFGSCVLFTSALVLLAFFVVTHGATLYVSQSVNTTHCTPITNGYNCATISDALQLMASGDIMVVRAGTYSGVKNMHLAPRVSNIIISSEDGPQHTTIELGTGQLLSLSNPEWTNITLKGFTVANGNASQGGAVYLSGVNFRIADSIFVNHTATYGGAIYLESTAFLEMENVEFRGNSASEEGGSIYVSSSRVVATKVSFLGNWATDNGGAIAIYDRSKVNGSHVIADMNRSGSSGGFVSIQESSIYIDFGTFRTNDAVSDGGVFFGLRGTIFTRNSTYFNNTSHGVGGAAGLELGGGFHTDYDEFSSNRALFGGGAVRIEQQSKLFMRGATIHGGYASKGGAVAFETEAQGIISNSLITGNTATAGGVIWIANSASVVIESSLLTNNTATQGGGAIYCSNAKVNISQSDIHNNVGSRDPAIDSDDFFCSTTPPYTFCRVSSDDAAWNDYCPEDTGDSSSGVFDSPHKNALYLILGFGGLGVLLCVGCMVAFIIYTRRNNRIQSEGTSWTPLGNRNGTALESMEDYDDDDHDQDKN